MKKENKAKVFLKSTKNRIKNFIVSFNAANYFRLYLGLTLVVLLVLVAIILLQYFGMLEKFQDANFIKSLLDKPNNRIVAIIIYFLIQFAQVSFVPIPAAITITAGVLVFGNWYEPLIYSLAAIIPASIFSFYLGRWLGKPFVSWMVGKDNMEKYLKKTAGKERPLFFMMFLLPFFPDDILCMVAGITPMSFKFFFITQLICRPPAVIGTILVADGILNKNFLNQWYGIVLIILALILFVAAVILTIKYATQIEQFFTKLFTRKSKKNKLKVIKNSNSITEIKPSVEGPMDVEKNNKKSE